MSGNISKTGFDSYLLILLEPYSEQQFPVHPVPSTGSLIVTVLSGSLIRGLYHNGTCVALGSLE